MPREEDLLPEELRGKQLKSAGNIRGWKYEDIPRLVEACRDLGLSIYSCKTAFIFPDASCELYWKRANPKLKSAAESWPQYVERSGSDLLRLIEELKQQTDFEKEGMSFDVLKKKRKAGVNILDYLCFEIEIVPESRYFKFLSDL